MNEFQKADLIALLSGMTPANSFAWPSRVGGELGVIVPGPPLALEFRLLFVGLLSVVVGAFLLLAYGSHLLLYTAMGLNLLLAFRALARIRYLSARRERLRQDLPEL